MMPPGPLAIPRLARPVSCDWAVPGSKSLTNRALALAALAEGESTVSGCLDADDTVHMRNCLTALGVSFTAINGSTWRVRGGRSRLRVPAGPLFVGNSGTTVRFLAAIAALVPGPVTFTGDAHMAKRPIADLVEALREAGIRVDCPTGCPPLTVHGTGRLPTELTVRGERSSQYLSGLLLAAAGAGSGVTCRIVGELVSRPYVRMTLGIIADFGLPVGEHADTVAVGAGTLTSRNLAVEPDASAASYPLALAAATGSRIRVPGLDRHSRQGDVAFVQHLAAAGCVVADRDGALICQGSGRVGVDGDLHHISDTVMTLAALAPLLSGPTTIRNIANIRIKETDRLLATVTELRRLGQQVEHGDDWLHIDPRPVTPATVQCYADHRMAMSFAILGADPACVAKTYPGFWHDLAGIYVQAGQERPW
jgi:3-phosphoshikimate 1-carboxyvinyltransferase